MVVVPALGLSASAYEWTRPGRYDSGSSLCCPATAAILPYVRKGRLPCLFGLCPGGVRRWNGNSVSVMPYAAGSGIACSSSAVSGQRYQSGETAGPTAVYSLYYSIFLDDYGSTVFPECDAYLCINSCAFSEKVL